MTWRGLVNAKSLAVLTEYAQLKTLYLLHASISSIKKVFTQRAL
jgi:hypothetical protein